MSVGPAKAAAQAEQAADDAVRGAGLAIDAAREAEKDAAAIKELLPDVRREVADELASHEAGAILNIGPKRNRWRDLQAFDEQLAVLEQRREQLSREIGEKRAEQNNEPLRLAAELDAWLMGGEKGARPASRAAALYEEIEGLEAEYGALGIGHERVLAERAAHVQKNRRKMLGDIREHVETAATEYRALVDQLEEKRRELLELRATEVWTAIYPSPTLTNEPSTARAGRGEEAVAGAAPSRPAVRCRRSLDLQPVARRRRLLRVGRDRRAGGARAGRLGQQVRRSDARWIGDGRQDLVGPKFDAAWGKSPEEQEQAERIAAYQEHQRRVVWGEE